MPTPPKSSLPGGIVLVAFPATVLLAMRVNGAHLPMPWPILFAVFFVYGIRAVATGLSWLDIDGTVSWLVDAAAAAGFAAFAFWIARNERDGWDGGVPFLPDGWNQNLARALFACGGALAALFAARCLLKAFNVYRNRPDDGVGHT